MGCRLPLGEKRSASTVWCQIDARLILRVVISFSYPLAADPEGLGFSMFANSLIKELHGKVKVGCFNYKLSKGLAGEFGVRKFNLPQVCALSGVCLFGVRM